MSYELLGILLPLILLMYLAFKGITLLILAPLMALLAAILTGGLPPIAAYTQVFMMNAADFIFAFFPLFFLGAIFGKLMDDSGSANAIARWIVAKLGKGNAILSVVICCAVLTYGGVSLFVVAFAIFPIAAALFRDADVPKRLIPGAIALGAFTFTMSAMPGTPAIQNAIPMPYFGTTAFAAPGLGIFAAIIMFGLGIAWLNFRERSARTSAEGYGAHEDAVPEPDSIMRAQTSNEGFDVNEIDPADPDLTPPGIILATAPIVIVVAVNLLFVSFLLPHLDTDYLAKPLFGETSVEAVGGVWAIVVALTTSILFLIAVDWRQYRDLRETLNKGADASVLPIFNTASLVGFGGVVAALPAFALVTEALMSASGGNPLVSVAMSVTTLSAMTGSASGGMSIALDALGDTFRTMADSSGTSLEAMHRVTSVSSGALDALPHNGAVITVLAIAKLTHKDSYFDIFVTAVVIPFLALVAIILLAGAFGGF
ncbi:GntP family permease [Ruegeria sp. B32]|uniref:GntP family permease n=1 Tax=Ruegeria sp. B32 TaxID=2867020 RepID=UPI0021A8C7D0|nr:GntP family permease [Ruegeria sp. B32]